MFNNAANLPFTMNVEPAGTNNGGAFGDGAYGGGWFFWIIIILLIFGWGGNYGYGGYGGAGGQIGDNYVLASDMSMLSRQMSDGFNNQERRTDAIINGISTIGYDSLAQTNSIITQMNNNAVNAMKDTFAVQTAINGVNVNNNTNTQALLSQMANNESNRQACCCATDNLIATNFGNLKYDIAAQDCQTRQTINTVGRDLSDVNNANTREILAAIQGIRNDALNDKIATLQAENQTLKFAASQQAQNAYIVASQADQTQTILDKLSPCPRPCYVVNSPQPVNIGCGCNC